MKYMTTSVLPSSGQVGEIASKADVRRMLLTHLSTTITLADLPEILGDIEETYQGEVMLAEDLMVIEV